LVQKVVKSVGKINVKFALSVFLYSIKSFPWKKIGLKTIDYHAKLYPFMQ